MMDTGVGREILWNAGSVGQWITYVFMVVTFVLLFLGIKKRYAMWKIGKPEPINFTKTAGARIGYFIKSGIFHSTILRAGESFPGWMHFFIFWGFLVLTIGTALVALQADFTDLLFNYKFLTGNFYLWSFFLDLAGLIAVIGILMAMYRRYVAKPERINDNRPDDFICLIWILVVLVSGFLVEAARIAATRPDYEVWSFIGWFLAGLFRRHGKGSNRDCPPGPVVFPHGDKLRPYCVHCIFKIAPHYYLFPQHDVQGS